MYVVLFMPMFLCFGLLFFKRESFCGLYCHVSVFLAYGGTWHCEHTIFCFEIVKHHMNLHSFLQSRILPPSSRKAIPLFVFCHVCSLKMRNDKKQREKGVGGGGFEADNIRDTQHIFCSASHACRNGYKRCERWTG